MSLRNGSDAICEKLLVLNPWNINSLEKLENEMEKIWNILQLRVHPAIIKLRNKIKLDKSNSKYDIDLTYLHQEVNGIIVLGKVMFRNRVELLPILEYIFLICYHGYLEKFNQILFM